MWQDIALTTINFCFMLTLIPAIVRNYRLKDTHTQSLLTYSLTAVLLTIMSLVLYTVQDLSTSSITTGGTAVMWYILTYQKIKYSKK